MQSWHVLTALSAWAGEGPGRKVQQAGRCSRQGGAAGLLQRQAGIVPSIGARLPRGRLHEASLPVTTALRAEGPRSSAPDFRDSHGPALGSSQWSSSWDWLWPDKAWGQLSVASANVYHSAEPDDELLLF